MCDDQNKENKNGGSAEVDQADFYIPDPNRFFAEFFLDENRELILKRADDNFLKLYGLFGKRVLMKNAREIMSEEFVEDMFEGVNHAVRYNDMREFFREFEEDGKISVWKVHKKSNGLGVRFLGDKIETKNITLFDFEHRVKDFVPNFKNRGTALLTECESDWKINFLDDSIVKKASWLREYEYLGDIEKEKADLSELIGILNKKTKCRYYDSLAAKSFDMLAYISVEAFTEDGKSKAFLTISLVSRESAAELNDNCGFFSSDFNNDIIAEAEFSIFGEEWSISDINPFMLKLINDKRISKESLVNSAPFRNSIKNMFMCSGILCYNNYVESEENKKHRREEYVQDEYVFTKEEDKGELFKYILTAAPLFDKDGTIKKIRIVLIPTGILYGNDIMNMSELTKRQKEILTLAANGKTNKVIAMMLEISEGTVKTICYNCYRKFCVYSKMEMFNFIFGGILSA